MSIMNNIHTVVYDSTELQAMMTDRLSQMIHGETLEFRLGDNQKSFRVTRLDEDNYFAEFESRPKPVQQPRNAEVPTTSEVARFLRNHEEGNYIDPNTLATESVVNRESNVDVDKTLRNVDRKTITDVILKESYGETLSYPEHDWKVPAKDITLKDLIKRVDGFPKSDLNPKELMSNVKEYRKDSSNNLQYTTNSKQGIKTIQMEQQPMMSQQTKEMILDQATSKAPMPAQQMSQQM